jgi:hypothetical protein
MGFEYRDRHVGEEGLLTLDPGTEYVLWEGVGVYCDQVLSFDILADVHEALCQRVKPPLVTDEGGTGGHFETIKTAYECKFALQVI